MSEQIRFFKKPVTDSTQPNVTATASQSSDLASYATIRGFFAGWVTTGSVDADNTTFEIDWVDERTVDSIFLLKHNFKAFTVQYWNGATYQNFSPAISETTNTEMDSFYSVTGVDTSKIKITITGTMVADADKYLYYAAACESLGQLEGWPLIKNPKVSKATKVTRMLSGKADVAQNVGGFSCELKVKHWRIVADLEIIENLYSRYESFLVWLCGGDATQFFFGPLGYTRRDLVLMRTVNEYEPEYVEGVYVNGLDLTIKLEEVVE